MSLGVLFAATAVGLPQLDRWQAQQEARLQVRLETDPADLVFVAYPDGESAVESLQAAEEAACMASMSEERPARQRRDFDAAAVAKEINAADADPGVHDDLEGLTLSEAIRLALVFHNA